MANNPLLRDAIPSPKMTDTGQTVRSINPQTTSQVRAVPERRHTVSFWFYILGFLAFLTGCYLLFIEDAVQFRHTTTLPSRSEAPTRPGQAFPGLASTPQTGSQTLPRGFDTRGSVTTPRAAVVSDGTAQAFPAEFLDSVWRDAETAGVKRATFDRAFANNRTLDPSVLVMSTSQPEFDRTIGDYVTSIVNTDRIATGRARLEQYAPILSDLERRYGVDRHVLLAIWGLESNFGVAKGDRSMIHSLATLAAAETRRAAFWKSELVAALSIVEQEKIAPERLVGSWAGAMGHTQFMPSTYLRHAVDFDGDGTRDVWSSVPDALASTARYLQASGWTPNRAWGREVVLPGDFDYALATPSAARPMTGWRVLGLRAQSGVLPADDAALWQLIVPAGAGGPAFLVSPNFEAVLSYNRAYSYAVAVGALADRIAGTSPIQAAWPVGDVPMSRDQRVEMQEILASLGLDVGGIDGIIGTKTRDAIRSFQKARGIAADGHPSLTLLTRMRTDRRL
jgi:membrane-bound lytic murein transglycosylase B